MVKPEYIEGWRRRFEQQRLEDEARAERARQALPQVVAILRKYDVKRIIVFGSLLLPGRFHKRSDIDVAVEGLAPKDFFRAYGELMMSLDWRIDLKPFEEVDDFFRGQILERGEVVYAR